jgi:hypothetical protein
LSQSTKRPGVKRNSHVISGQPSVDELVGLRIDQGDQEAMELAAVLGRTCSAQFLRELISYKGALEAVGGQLYITAIRRKFTDEGQQVGHNEAAGQHRTVAFTFAYDSTVQARAADNEPDAETHDLDLSEVKGEQVDHADEPEPDFEAEPEQEPELAGAGDRS